MQTQKQILGRFGEDCVVERLRRDGFEIMERNWRSGHHEIDIIARKWDRVHFVEVKTRRADAAAPPEAAVTQAKCAAVYKAANHYMALRRIELEPQFDVAAVEVYPDGQCEIRYTEDAM